MIEELNLINGKIKSFRDKFDNTHLDTLKDVKLNENTYDRYEIYSVIDKNDKILTIGDGIEHGLISDFFVINKEIHFRYNHVILKNNKMKIKKYCIKL